MKRGTVRFDDAYRSALSFCQHHQADLGPSPVLVRDVVGRIRVATRDQPSFSPESLEELHGLLGAWSPGKGSLVLVAGDLLDPDAIFNSPEARSVGEGLRFLDRRLSGRDWIPLDGDAPNAGLPTIAFFGVKGGVGRSTALSVIARRLAEQGQRVMVLDLDLESPGVSSLLLPHDAGPRFGIVDWLVESGVGQADHDLFRSMLAASPLAAGTSGQIQVIPAAGDAIDTYISKLARVQTSSDSASGYASALARLLRTIAEADRPPSVVLLDCRAGIDDLAAVPITKLATDALLFAGGTPQTWFAYRMLFSIWNKDARILEKFRHKLQVVAALVPETERDQYMDRLRSSAYDLFTELVYEEEPPSPRFDLFNFDLNDNEAPHYAVPIFWRRELQDYDPIHRPSSETRDGLAAYDALAGYVEGCLVDRSEAAR